MADTAELVSNLMASSGIGAVTGTVTIFLGRYGSAPNDAIAVRVMPGSGTERAFGPSIGAPVRDRPDVQILVRNSLYANGAAKAEEIVTKLDHYAGTLGGKRFNIQLAYGWIYLGVDENNRHQFSIVFHIHRER